jgi:hypothetical protein
MASPRNSDSPKKLSDSIHERTLSFSLCPKHNSRYPVGQRCPKCEAEEKKNSEPSVS